MDDGIGETTHTTRGDHYQPSLQEGVSSRHLASDSWRQKKRLFEWQR